MAPSTAFEFFAWKPSALISHFGASADSSRLDALLPKRRVRESPVTREERSEDEYPCEWSCPAPL
jgi:hypothetical protein